MSVDRIRSRLPGERGSGQPERETRRWQQTDEGRVQS
jgi:hypothetical protein